MSPTQPQSSSPVDIALAIKRGQLRLANVPEAQRPLVRSVLGSMTDAQAQTIIGRREKAVQPRGFERVMDRRSLS